jgi:hypothetical protein
MAGFTHHAVHGAEETVGDGAVGHRLFPGNVFMAAQQRKIYV